MIRSVERSSRATSFPCSKKPTRFTCSTTSSQRPPSRRSTPVNSRICRSCRSSSTSRGAISAFLRYYGTQNTNELIGKTDKDLGWHLSNLEMDQTEKCVLEHGEPVHDGQGRCIARGRQHAITFSKYPIYQGTEIVGLLGESCSSSRNSPPSRSSTGRPSDALYCAVSVPSSARTCPPPS